jgi:hypothetical protein
VEYNPRAVQNSTDIDGIGTGALFAVRDTDHSDEPLVLETRHTFSTRFFLDPSVSGHPWPDVSNLDTTVPYGNGYPQAGSKKTQLICERYFGTIHRWLPILSKQRIYQNLLISSSQPRADRALLYLCMELVTQSPLSFATTPRSDLYLAARKLHGSVEIRGILTLEVLQAAMLIAVYELGHAVYPSAYLSIGVCARYATALGVNEKTKDRVTWPLTMREVEEGRRAWWAILILDRYVNVSYSLL